MQQNYGKIVNLISDAAGLANLTSRSTPPLKEASLRSPSRWRKKWDATISREWRCAGVTQTPGAQGFIEGAGGGKIIEGISIASAGATDGYCERNSVSRV